MPGEGKQDMNLSSDLMENSPIVVANGVPESSRLVEAERVAVGITTSTDGVPMSHTCCAAWLTQSLVTL
jgi:hypothetical protein